MKIKQLTFIAVVFLLLASSFLANAQTGGKPIRLGVFADADSLPFMLCETEGLFAAEGVDVELLRFQSAVERDSAFQAGAVDGVITDVMAVILAVQGGFPVRITSLTDGRYGIAVSPGLAAASLKDLAGKPIGISSNSVIHYMVDTLMSAAGVAASDINLMPIPKMPVRLETMLAGQTAAAGMPEPFLTTARVRGARIIASTDDYGLGVGVLAFTSGFLSSRAEAVEKLYRAYWKAAQRINANPDDYRSLLVKKAGFSDEAAKAYSFVVYRKPRLPTLDDMGKAAAWLSAKGLLKKPIDTASLLDGRSIARF
jgi:NitT/TauT family transport system substrate-binding protein